MPSPTSASRWIEIPRPTNSPRVRLLCFPHGGGGATGFNEWPEYLPEDIEVCAVQFPGRGRRLFEAPPTSIDQVVEALLEAFQPFRGTPVALFGHSLGAWVAFEFARRLQERKTPIVHLFVSGQTAPHLPDPEAPIRDWPDREFITEVHQRYGGFPEEILHDDEMMALLLPALRADFTMKETYRYSEGPLLECPISSFGGYEDGSVAVDDLAAWRDRTGSAFRFKVFSGGHFFIDSARESVLESIVLELESPLREAPGEGRLQSGE